MSNVQSLDRSLNLLELISKHSPISLNQLVSLSGLSKTTIHRLVQSLIENDYVKKDHLTHQYELTYKLFQLGYASIQNIDYLYIAKSLISKLAIDVGETFHLVLEDKDEVLYIEKFIPNEAQQSMSSKIGLRSPMYCTAVSKAILSTYNDDTIHKIWQTTTVKAYTENTIIHFDNLM